MTSPEESSLFPIFSSEGSDEPPARAPFLPPEEGVMKELKPDAPAELPDNRDDNAPSQFDKLDGFGDPYSWF